MTRADVDAGFMRLALRLAAKGRGRTSPNPMVGALVVAGGRIVGRGYHRRAGGPHAEVHALQAAGLRARGATLYVTLEPCSHRNKRTPPCVPAILASGIRRVVVPFPDPNPKVQGRGIRRFRRAGIRVDVGCLKTEAAQLNVAYSHRMRAGLPFVTLKGAITLDGKMATATGESRWITGRLARQHAHGLRCRSDAVLVGVGTVLRDDPRLTARVLRNGRERPAPRQPWRVVVDSRLRTPPTARVLKQTSGSRVVVVTTTAAPRARVERLQSRGVLVLIVRQTGGRVSLRACLKKLVALGATSVLIEGGAEVNASALREGVVNRLVLYVAPRLLGGQDAKSFLGGASPRRITGAVSLRHIQVRRMGTDLVIQGDLES
ncbi:MAG: bifunctional diaminohydroxyphosphoribosylaminopyrimidine deaminase/5-amino-6-(5-phosphoribosylamino)uracil reductase RibD [Nitrospirales bacterium]